MVPAKPLGVLNQFPFLLLVLLPLWWASGLWVSMFSMFSKTEGSGQTLCSRHGSKWPSRVAGWLGGACPLVSRE